MNDLNPSPKSSQRGKLSATDPMLERLRSEAKAPYRGLRKVVYGVVAASALIGSFVFLMKTLAGEGLGTNLQNLVLQVAVLALMVWLLRLEGRRQG